MTLAWPFQTSSPAQYQRVDQGWDLQSTPGAAVVAVAPGILGSARPDPGGFGVNYPFETLDPNAVPAGAPSDTVYYGHTHVISSLLGEHVDPGEVIAYTNVTAGEQGSASPAGWLEIGWAQPGTGAPVQHGPEGSATAAGAAMRALLLGAPLTSSASSSSGSTDATLMSSSGSSGAAGVVSGAIKPLTDWLNSWAGRSLLVIFGTAAVIIGVAHLTHESAPEGSLDTSSRSFAHQSPHGGSGGGLGAEGRPARPPKAPPPRAPSPWRQHAAQAGRAAGMGAASAVGSHYGGRVGEYRRRSKREG